MSTAGLIAMFAMYFIYMYREKKKQKKIEREAEEEAARAKKWEEEEAKRINERKEAKRKHYEEVLSKVSYPDPLTSSRDEMYDFIDSLDYDPNVAEIAYAYSELANKKLGITNFYSDYSKSRITGKFTK